VGGRWAWQWWKGEVVERGFVLETWWAWWAELSR